MNIDLKSLFGQIKSPVFFVTPEINWALGLEEYLPNYHIVCLEDHPVIDLLPKKVNVFCLKREFSQLKCPKNTGAMLCLPVVQRYIKENSSGTSHHTVQGKPAVMCFKPSAMIDKVCKEKSYLQIGNSASLNRKWEDKLELVKLSEEYAELSVVPGKIARLQDFVWEGEMVVQTARGWGGKSTFLVSNNEGLEDLKRRLGDVKAKVSPFINGRTYLNNVCVVDGEVLQSPPALQINCPNKNFSSLPLTTCGRQFGNLVLDKEQISQMREITDKVGLLMAEDGYKGYFGLDFIVEDGTGKVFLQEINARLTASSSFYTTLEIEAGRAPLLFGHIGAFLNDKSGYTSEVSYFLNNNKNDSSEVSGMQLIIRNSKVKLVKIKNELMPGIYKLDDGKFEFARSSYQVTDVKTEDEFLLISPGKGSEISPESELLRCESKFAVMEEGRVPGRLKKTLVGLKKSLLGDLVLEYSLR